jgi:hypothetical protein
MWFIYWFILGVYIGRHDWSDLLKNEIDCTHAWRNDHCYVCGKDRNKTEGLR